MMARSPHMTPRLGRSQPHLLCPLSAFAWGASSRGSGSAAPGWHHPTVRFVTCEPARCPLLLFHFLAQKGHLLLHVTPFTCDAHGPEVSPTPRTVPGLIRNSNQEKVWTHKGPALIRSGAVRDHKELTFPVATIYSKSAIQGTLANLHALKGEICDLKCTYLCLGAWKLCYILKPVETHEMGMSATRATAGTRTPASEVGPSIRFKRPHRE